MLDSKIKAAGEKLGVVKPEDWQKVRPEQIRAIHGCGPETVNHLRLYLAARGLTLRDDATPSYWQQNLAAARIGGTIAKTDVAVVTPFTVLIDNQEKIPFSFQGITADSDQNYRPLIVPTVVVSMGPTHGDYSLQGFEGQVHVERKGVGDAIGTFLARGERHDRWLATLEFLASVSTAAVVVECTLGKMIKEVVSRGSRSVEDLRKTLHRQVLAWEQDYRVPFVFCDTPRLAELSTFSILNRHYRHAVASSKIKIDPEILAAVDDL
jgi:hypothetical protein